MKIEKVKIADLKPNPKNPRKSDLTQEANLKASLEKFGVVEPIIFNKRSGQIVGGHFRVRELQKMGVKEVEAVIVDLSEQDEAELNIRLNANTGEWDWEILYSDWDSDELEEWGLEVSEKIEDIIELEKITTTFNINIKCETPEQVDELKQKLGINANNISYNDLIKLLK